MLIFNEISSAEIERLCEVEAECLKGLEDTLQNPSASRTMLMVKVIKGFTFNFKAIPDGFKFYLSSLFTLRGSFDNVFCFSFKHIEGDFLSIYLVRSLNSGVYLWGFVTPGDVDQTYFKEFSEDWDIPVKHESGCYAYFGYKIHEFQKLNARIERWFEYARREKITSTFTCKEK